MCDHFASNSSNPGWTSTGGGGIYLKKIQEHFHGAIGSGTLKQDLQNYQDSEDIGTENLNLAGTRGSNYLNLESGDFAKSNGE